MEYNINFTNENLIVSVKEGTNLAKACEEAGLALDLVCGGRGTCGKCKVQVNTGHEMTDVLACQTSVTGDMSVYLSKEDRNDSVHILASNIEDYTFKPHVTKTYIEKAEINKVKLKNCDLFVLKKFSDLYYKEIEGITLINYEGKIIDIQEGDKTGSLYGVAVDIGTTTVVIYVYDLITGRLLNTFSDINSQFSTGADLISRISYGSSKDGLRKLNEMIVFTLNKLLKKAEKKIPDLSENLYNIVICGNTVMEHLFLGLRPDSLGSSPFMSITHDLLEFWGYQTEVICAPRCKIVFLPILGGFVGADTAALLLTVKEENKTRLIIDLGTNGEIAIGNINGYYVTSAASGPALEGGNIECGMRAASGAIEGFKIENGEIVLKVVSDRGPIGICGSGIIDIVAELLKNNIIDRTGRMRSHDEFVGINPYSKLADRIEEINGVNSFLIYEPGKKNIPETQLSMDKVYISQKDIRQIQLSKSSIYSACMTILDAYGKTIDEIDELIVAGAFGNYINDENAMYIGLLPRVKGKIRSIGNGAGKGVALYLLDKNMKKKLNKIVENSKHIQLADKEIFTDNYIRNMNF